MGQFVWSGERTRVHVYMFLVRRGSSQIYELIHLNQELLKREVFFQRNVIEMTLVPAKKKKKIVIF